MDNPGFSVAEEFLIYKNRTLPTNVLYALVVSTNIQIIRFLAQSKLTVKDPEFIKNYYYEKQKYIVAMIIQRISIETISSRIEFWNN